MKTLATIEGERITELSDGTVTYKAKAAVDCDGTGRHYGDPCAQSDTSLHLGGKALNADEDKYVVVPPAIIHGVKGAVLGCQAFVTNTKNGMSSAAVVGDIGPKTKLGEISVACAKAIGLDPSPTKGGTDEHVIHYSLSPGVAAVVDSKVYALQPLRIRHETIGSD